MLCVVWELRETFDVLIRSIDAQKSELEQFDPCRSICSRFHKIKTSLFKYWTPL